MIDLSTVAALSDMESSKRGKTKVVSSSVLVLSQLRHSMTLDLKSSSANDLQKAEEVLT